MFIKHLVKPVKFKVDADKQILTFQIILIIKCFLI